MTDRINLRLARLRCSDGYVLPVILAALLIMSVVAIAALVTSGDEQRSSEAMRQSSLAFYAAEAGVQQIWGSWDTTKDSLVSALNPGDTLDLGWQNLTGGAEYHGMVIRTDDASGKPAYMMAVEGKGPGARGGRRMLSVALTGGGGGGGPYTLGECCNAGATTRGIVKVNTSLISGEDSLPPGWDDGRCSEYTPTDVAGIIAKDSADLDVRSDADWRGSPQFIEDPGLSDADFSTFGGLSYDSLRAMATTQLLNWGGSQKGLKYGGDPAPAGCRSFPVTSGSSSGCYIGPRYTPEGACDTGHPLNFGAPSGPCKDYYPVVLISGDWAFRGDNPGGYAQGIFVMDTSAAGYGSEFDMEKGSNGFTIAGLVIGKGCFEMDKAGPMRLYGAIFSDGYVTPRSSCGSDQPVYLHSGTGIQYSQCAVQRALKYSGVGDAANPGGGGVTLISSRAMREILR